MTWALRDPEGYLTDSATHCIIERSFFHNNREQKASIYAAMKRAKPHIPEMRQNQSGDEYQADDQVAGRPTISPLPLLQGGALLFALLILLALEICIRWPSVAVIVSRYSYFRGGGPFFFSQHDTFSFHFSTQLPSLLFRHHVHVEWVWFHRLCQIPGD